MKAAGDWERQRQIIERHLVTEGELYGQRCLMRYSERQQVTEKDREAIS